MSWPSLVDRKLLRLTKNREKIYSTACNSAQIGRIDVVISVTPFHWSINGREGGRLSPEKKENVTTKKKLEKVKKILKK